MYGKLVHRPPFGHHYHAPRPPFGEPREVGERYLGHPELTDYWIKPYLLEALKHYPRLDDECVVEGLWKFANTICLQNKHTSIRTPPTYDDPVTTHKIAFLDKDDIELGCIKFWRKVDSTFGIDMILNGRGISITGNNDDPTLCLVDTPIGDNKKQIVNIEYLDFRLSTLQDLIDGLTDRVEALEDYKDQADSLIKDPNGNFRTVHTAIHNDSDDQNIPTCYAVYQFGKGISDALNARIDNLPSVIDSVQDGNMHPVTSNAVADELTGIRGTLSSLGSSISSTANEVANLQSAINNSGGGSSGNNSSGSLETEGTHAGWRIWRSGNLAAIHIPAGAITAYNAQTASVELPFQVDSIIYHNHPSTGTGGNSTWTLSIDTDGNYLDLTYTGGGLSPGQGINYAFDIICWLK